MFECPVCLSRLLTVQRLSVSGLWAGRHGVRLPAQFVERARALVMDDLEVDESWWFGLRGTA
jgi:hypothetical protein